MQKWGYDRAKICQPSRPVLLSSLFTFDSSSQHVSLHLFVLSQHFQSLHNHYRIHLVIRIGVKHNQINIRKDNRAMSRSTRPSGTMSRNQYSPPVSPIHSELDQRRLKSPIPRETLPAYREEHDETDRIMSAFERSQADRAARRRRMIENPTPLFVKRPSAGSMFARSPVGPRIAETTKALAEKTNSADFENMPEPPLNIPKTWGSRARKREKWLQKILYPESTEEVGGSPQPNQTLPHQLAQFEEPDNNVQNKELDHYELSFTSVEDEKFNDYEKLLPSVEADEAYPTEEYTPPSMSRKSKQNAYDDSKEPQSAIPLPRTWGSRAKRTHWMHKIVSPDDPLDRFSPPSSEIGNKFSDGLLPSADILSAQEPTPPSSRPASAQPTPHRDHKDNIDFHDPWNTDDDFTSTSLTTSPVLRIKNSRLDEIRRQEIYSLSEKDEDLADLSDLPVESPRVQDRHPQVTTEQAPVTTQQSPVSAAKQPQTPSSEERGRPTPTTPVPFYLNGVYQGIIYTDAPAPNSPKEDSIETLRKLSRAMSKSPAPPVKRQEGDDENKAEDPEERIAAEARLFEIPDNKSDRNSSRPSRSTSPINGNHDQGTAPSSRDQTPDINQALPAPKIARTPISAIRKHIAHRRSQSLSSPDCEIMYMVGDRPSSSDGTKPAAGHPRGRSSSAPIINTAKLTTAAEDVAEIQRQVEAEIPSVEDLDTLFGLEGRAMADLPKKKEASLIVPQTERERLIEQQCIDRINQAFKNTSSTIRDATHGLERLEQQVSSLPDSGGNSAPLESKRDFATVQQQNSSHATTSNDKPMVKLKLNIEIPFPHYRRFRWLLMMLLVLLLAFAIGVIMEVSEGQVAYGGASDWWLGRPGPIGVTKSMPNSSMFADEVVY